MYVCMYVCISVSVRASASNIAPMRISCHDRCLRITARHDPLLRDPRVLKASRIGLWIGLFTTVLCVGHPILPSGPRPCWTASRTSTYWFRSAPGDPSTGTATPSCDSSAGRAAAFTWKSSCGAQAGRSLPRLPPGDARKVTSPLRRCLPAPPPRWTASLQWSCGPTMNGSKLFSRSSPPAMTELGSLLRATSTARARHCCSSAFGHMWSFDSKTDYPTDWSRRWRTPCSTWPRRSGTRTTSWSSCPGSPRWSSYLSSNGSRRTNGTNFWLCRRQRTPLRPPRRPLIATPCRGARMIPRQHWTARPGWRCYVGDYNQRMDRPGPNSGGKWCSSLTRSRTDVSLPTTFSISTPGSWASLADVRVEGRLGCTPSEAAPPTSDLRCSEAKFCDPIEVFEDCPQGPGFPGTLAVQCRRSSCQSDSTHVVLYQLCRPAPHHSLSLPTPADVATFGDPTLQQPAPAGPCLGSTHYRPLRDPFGLLGVATAVGGILMSFKQRRRMTRWAVFRIISGQYRRRPLKEPHADLAPSRRARLPAMPPPPNRKPVGFKLLPLPARLLGFILLCSFSPLASSHRTAQTPQAAPHLPTFSEVTAHGHRISQLTPARKRAFRRAQIRAVQHGSTRYRGQQHDLHSLSALKFRRPRQVPTRPQLAQPNPANTPVHMSFVSWNCGGLHAARFTELLAWLHDAPNQGRTVPKIVCAFRKLNGPKVQNSPPANGAVFIPAWATQPGASYL